MEITEKTWVEYITRLARLNETAGQKMAEYIARYGTGDVEALIDYAYALIQKYGEGSAELACQMYDAVAQGSGANVPPAEPAAPAGYQETARMIQATRQSSPQMQGGVSRLVKQAGADTTLKNAIRDGAEWAWVPHGDTCPFCITLASRGWQRASAKTLAGGHASHIHAHCDCAYAVRFDHDTTVVGYDPDRYLEQYHAAGGDLNAMRRAQYAKDKDEINAQKRAAYAKRNLSTDKRESVTINKENVPLRNFASDSLFQRHYEKHEKEFGGVSGQEYLERANAFADQESSDDIVELIRADGSLSKYCFSTNEFLVINADGTIRTYFKPKNGEDYWNVELERNK